jgi:CHAD domain-containing protein
VRDGDVLLERMRRAAEELPVSSRPDSEPVLEALQTSRDEARGALLEALRSERYVGLLDRLVAAANAPVLAEDAQRRARTVLPGLVRRPWRSLQKRVKALGKHPSHDALHDIRVRTKRVRYAAEAVAPISGKQARAFARAAARLQEVLGELNDAVVAEAWLREWAREGRSANAVGVAEELATHQRVETDRYRRSWKKAWRELSDPKLRAWM